MATYYVSYANGTDVPSAGTIGNPWKNLEYAFKRLSAGDILYMRGGNYRTTYADDADVHMWWNEGVSGTAANHITILNYPGEVPVFNFDDVNSGAVYGDTVTCIALSGATYLDITGLRIVNYTQTDSGSYRGAAITGLAIWNCSNCTFNNIEVDHIGGYGITIGNSSDLTFNNCDVHSCVDYYSMMDYEGNPAPRYDNANGFGITTGSPNTTTRVIFNNCRAWNNSDDGFDFYGVDGVITLNNCWAFWNGYDESFNPLGNGQGFKCGPAYTTGVRSADNIRIYNNCLAFGNRANGFDQNTSSSWGTHIHHFNNCAAYGNGNIGFAFSYGPYQNTANVFKNCISYLNGTAYQYGSVPPVVSTNNSWTIPVAYNSADFVSVPPVILQINNVTTRLFSLRPTGGGLPELGLITPVSTSSLRNKGTVISENPTDMFGVAWAATPTIGPVEYVSGPVIPTLATTTSVTGITNTTANSGGNVTSDGGATITARGVCWSTSSSPIVTGSHTTESGTTGSFTSSMTGLTAGTFYYVRAYATNSQGTGYGAQVNFTTTGGGGRQDINIIGESLTGQVDPFTRSGISTVPSDLVVIANDFSESTATLYQLKAGDEGVASTNNYLDGSVITGNKFSWNVADRDNAPEATHQLMLGYNINDQVKYNLFSPAAVYGVVLKSGNSGVSMTDSIGYISYNIFKDFFEGVLCRGFSGARIYNNTFYNSTANLNGCVVLEENESAGSAPSQYTKIKNNIFYTVDYQCVINVRQPSCMVGLESDYNIFYSESGNIWFSDGTNQYIGLTNWQNATGQDMNSVVVNPNFIDFTNLVPLARLDYGTDLGADFQTGLSTSAVWTVGSIPDQVNQDSTWQVGARIFGSALTITTETATGITTTTASLHGTTSAIAGAQTEKGLCYSTSPNPTTSSTKVIYSVSAYDASPTPPPYWFTCSIFSLVAGTTYYVRAYVINNGVTIYGNEITFVTSTASLGAAIANPFIHKFYIG